MLTNFTTISSRVGKLREFEAMERSGDFDAMPKKEGLRHRRELEKLRRNLGGIRDLDRLPDSIFVIDTKKEHIAVTEANKLNLPVVAVVDTNCDPDVIDYVIPGNDDAIRSGSLMCRVIADAVAEGRWIASHRPQPEPTPGENGSRTGPARPPARATVEPPTTSRAPAAQPAETPPSGTVETPAPGQVETPAPATTEAPAPGQVETAAPATAEAPASDQTEPSPSAEPAPATPTPTEA
jgi:small subunit ribosomal protein S2